jgi:hypothetical protein
VRGARGLQLAFDLPQARRVGLHLVRHAADLLPVALALCGRFAPPHEPQQLLAQLHVLLVFLVLRRHRCLRLELLDLHAQLVADVVDARHVLARLGEPRLGLLAALLVARHARGFLEEHAQLLGLGLDDARDHSLLDDRVRARSEAGAEEHVGHVAPAARACC